MRATPSRRKKSARQPAIIARCRVSGRDVAAEPSDPPREAPARLDGIDFCPFIVAAAVVVFDQITKALVINAFGAPEEGKSTTIIPKLLDFRHDENTGAAFSLFQGRSTTLLLIGVVVIGVLVYYYRALPQGNPLLRAAVGAVLGGAVGNIIDRILLGH